MEEGQRNLESCLTEFFAQETTNERKRQIENMLDTFSKQPGSWKESLFYLTNGLNEYATMYCLSVVDNAIKFRWSLLSAHEQNELKSTLYSFLVQNAAIASSHKCQPPFVRNKVIKLLTDIGKCSWPHDQPDFFNNILHITQSPHTVVIGLWFLKTISEEWTSIGDEATTDRKLELKANLIKEVPKVFAIFETILDAGMKHRHTSSPGSPSVHDIQIHEVISLVLETAAHFCSWITLDGSTPSTSLNSTEPKVVPFPLSFVQILCKYSVLSFDASHKSSEAEVTLTMKALEVLNEICYRKYIPKEFEKHISFITHFGIELLNKFLNKNSATALEDRFLEKVIEFMCLIASSHFSHYDEQSAKAFLSLLLPFTFRQSEPVFYYKGLEIWGRLLDHLNTQLPIVSQMMNREEYIETYKQPILALANGIVHCTIKYQIPGEECFDLEDDDDVEVPSLARNIDILVKIGELLPTESLESLLTTWSESCRFFGSLQSSLHPGMKTVMRISNPVEIEHFNFIVQLIGRMASIFYGDVFKQEMSLGKSLFQQLVGVYNFSQRFYFVKDPTIIPKTSCEIVYALQSWIYWLVRFHSEVILGESTLEDQHMFFELLGILTEVVFSTLENHHDIDTTILLANVNFFLTLIGSVRTQFIFQVSSVQALVQKVHLLKATADPEVYRVLHKIVAALLLLPWQSVAQQEWDTRTRLYDGYMKKRLEEFFQNSSNPNSVILHLNLLNDQLELLALENANSKKMCWNVLKETVPFLQKLSATYLRQPKVSEHILNFFSKIMEVLRQQAGAPFFEDTIHGFLNLFSVENIINDLLRETETSFVVIEKFLQMLQFMVKDPSPSFKKFIGDTLSICYDHIYPVLAQRSTPDLKIPFFSLIRDTVNYRWTYFFPMLVLHQQNASSEASSSQQHQDQLVSKRLDQILQSIGHSFLQQDLEVFRYNLGTLSLWNEKHNFYVKLSQKVITQFMTVLLQVLIHKTHDLHREEMGGVLHEMASTDYVHFHKNFLPDFLSQNFASIPPDRRNFLILRFSSDGSCCKVTNSRDENRDQGIDLPTFKTMLNRFIEDLRHYYFLAECSRLCNQALNISEKLS